MQKRRLASVVDLWLIREQSGSSLMHAFLTPRSPSFALSFAHHAVALTWLSIAFFLVAIMSLILVNFHIELLRGSGTRVMVVHLEGISFSIFAAVLRTSGLFRGNFLARSALRRTDHNWERFLSGLFFFDLMI